MIFNIGNGPVRKLPVLDVSYPQDVTANAGDSVTFEVVIAEEGKPAEYTYQWYYDGSPVEGANEAAYTREAEFGDHTVYCLVTNKAGVVTSRTATVTANTQYLYLSGNEKSYITGGWGSYGLKTASTYTSKAPTLTKKTNELRATMTSLISSGIVRPVNQIDFTKYKTLYVDMAAQPKMWNYIHIAIYKSGLSNLGGATIPSATAKVQIANHTTGADFARKTYSLNVSNLSGKYYVGVIFHHADVENTMGIDVYGVWLK